MARVPCCGGDASFASVGTCPGAVELCRPRCLATVGMPIDATVGPVQRWPLAASPQRHRRPCCTSVVPQRRNRLSTVRFSACDADLRAWSDALGDTAVEIGVADPGRAVEHSGGPTVPDRWPPPGDTSVLHRDDGVVLASEPYDDHPGWRDILTATWRTCAAARSASPR